MKRELNRPGPKLFGSGAHRARVRHPLPLLPRAAAGHA